MKKNTPAERLINGTLLENPTLVLTLGMCPTLAVTTSAINGLGMGLTTTAVLMFSNLIISLLRNFIPDRVRIPSYIVVIASLVTIVQFLLQAYVPSLNDALGVYIPLIVVNCIILGRAESYAGKNGPISSFFDGIGMGLGFTAALTILGALRELLGAGTFFNIQVLPASVYTPITIFILAPGAFLVLSCMVAVQNRIKNNPPKAKEAKPEEEAGSQAADEGAEKAAETEAKAPETKAVEAKADEVKAPEKEAPKKEAAEPEKTAEAETKAPEKEAPEAKEPETKEAEKAEKAAEAEAKAPEMKADEAKESDTKEAEKVEKAAEAEEKALEAKEAEKTEKAAEAETKVPKPQQASDGNKQEQAKKKPYKGKKSKKHKKPAGANNNTQKKPQANNTGKGGES